MMVEKTYRRFLKIWTLKFIVFSLLQIIILAYAFTLGYNMVWGVSISVFIFVTGAVLWWKERPVRQDLIEHIHKTIPTTEYSLSLLDRKSEEMSMLQRLQQEKVLLKLKKAKIEFPKERKLIGYLIGLLLLSLVLLWVLGMSFQGKDKIVLLEKPPKNEKINRPIHVIDSLKLEEVRITITPPSYTKRAIRTQRELDVELVEGSKLSWKIDWSGTATKSELTMGEQEIVPIVKNQWLSKKIKNSTYYRYDIETIVNQLSSEYHAIEVIEDAVPLVSISGILEYQRLSFAENYNIDFTITADDDYGIDVAQIVTTIAKGQGESVKFREKKEQLHKFSQGSKKYKGQYSFSTKMLEMEPGDELYFHVRVKDNCPFRDQWARTPTYFVMLEDTMSYSFVEESGMQVDLMPDFFRSQRQIIIDSEQLLKDKPSLDRKEYNRRSNELGYDQKLLRLKYGQFLGEESESGIAIENETEEIEHFEEENHKDHDEVSTELEWSQNVIEEFMHDHDHEEEHGELLATKGTEKEDPSRPSWVEELSHNHDNMEEATFHGVSVKSKLRAALTEMWDAELHLRLFHPKTSLPYQRRSLVLLQEIKNHARIYVHRIGFDPPLIKETEKRLTGDITGVLSPSLIRDRLEEREIDVLKKGYHIIADRRFETSTDVIHKASQIISKRVLEDPSLLPVLNDIRKLIDGDISERELQRLERGLLYMIPKSASQPVVTSLFDHPITKAAISDLRGR